MFGSDEFLKSIFDSGFISLPFVSGYLNLSLFNVLRSSLKDPITPDVGVFKSKVNSPFSGVFIGTTLFESSLNLGPIHSNFNDFYDRSLLWLSILLEEGLLFASPLLFLMIFIEPKEHNREASESHLPVSNGFGEFKFLGETYHVISLKGIETQTTKSIEMVVHDLSLTEMHGFEAVVFVDHSSKDFLTHIKSLNLNDILGNSSSITIFLKAFYGFLLQTVAPEFVRYSHLLFDFTILNR